MYAMYIVYRASPGKSFPDTSVQVLSCSKATMHVLHPQMLFASEDIVCAVICNQAGHNAGSTRGLNVQGIGRHLT